MRLFDRLCPAKPLPTLETDRLYLRPLCRADADDLFEYARQRTVSRYVLWNPHPDVDYTRSYLAAVERFYRRGEYFDWAIVEKFSGKMIGTVGFTRLDVRHALGEIGYVLNPAFQKRGYATEAAWAVISHGFTHMNLHRIEGRYMAENLPSRRVMERCGMTFEGIGRQSMLVKGSYRDIGICAILADDYTSLRQGR